MSREDTLYAVALSILSSPATRDIWVKLAGAGPESVFRTMEATGPVETVKCVALRYGTNPYNAAEGILEASGKVNARVVHLWDSDYPLLLREISRPPIALYTRGPMQQGEYVAMVGTRRSDLRSDALAMRISGELAERGIEVVSGLALGIDRASHLGALGAGGHTTGVMANGIDILYPSANRDLYARIMDDGGSTLLSEYPPGVRADKWTFVRRNRIISGLARAVIVIKAGSGSGALITARYAIEQNRDVFACGGLPYDEGYEGCQRLIKCGASIFTSTDELLEESVLHGARNIRCKADRTMEAEPTDGTMTGPASTVAAMTDMTGAEERILSLLHQGDRTIDDLMALSGITPAEINEAAVSLELKGAVLCRGNRLILLK